MAYIFSQLVGGKVKMDLKEALRLGENKKFKLVSITGNEYIGYIQEWYEQEKELLFNVIGKSGLSILENEIKSIEETE